MIIAMIYIGLSIPVVSYVGLGGGEGGGLLCWFHDVFSYHVSACLPTVAVNIDDAVYGAIADVRSDDTSTNW